MIVMWELQIVYSDHDHFAVLFNDSYLFSMFSSVL